ncbi:MAG TPA: SCP2 sterol-binding domain-containing protein [Polyangiaceae bacterium]|nr:SCP2 sterol-binding domain-containing protein [Polyangiaceae bacterium]
MIVPESPQELVGEFLPRYVERLLGPASPAPGPAPAAPVSAHGASPPHPATGSASRSATSNGSATTNGSAPRASLRRAPAPAGVGLRVVGAGEWTLRMVGERLLVDPVIQDDVALQISLQARDFASLVVRPLRRALERRAPDAAQNTAGIWARLGRWDAETVDLLRRQSGGILLRISDADLQRNIALTPGALPYSLERADCTIDCALGDLEQLQEKQSSPLDLFYAGQIRISGDAQIALAMAGLFL